MLVSLNWIRDFVDLPNDVDPRALAEKFTCTTAEVEGIEHMACGKTGLITAQVKSVEPIPEAGGLFAVKVDTDKDALDTVTKAEGLKIDDKVVFAPPGANVPGIGKVKTIKTAGRTSTGMIVPGDALGLSTIGQRAVWLTPDTETGSAIDMSLFDDWIIEIDNKSITHRPDLWGHYGIARELAAICSLPLKPYPVVDLEELTNPDLPEIPIVIDDPVKCPRYSGLRFEGVRPLAAPLWMQVRLAMVGLRPIDILVDLTNYIMAELGQPMHAFDSANVDRIEVATAKPGEKFTTLDGFERKMPEEALMIQCNRKSVALAGIMGGAQTEVTEKTTSLLLESANFEPATIRRCATALGHRTDASARFEKSQDPYNTVLGIQRFVYLARPELPELKLTSCLSDAFPQPPEPRAVKVDPKFLGRYVGRTVSIDEIKNILTPLEFKVRQIDGTIV
ncbi:MAG: phenylalanine--tRNA ligase subunit beta, partial [Planctomycetota bacterium]